MILRSIDVAESGDLEFWFDDGDLFWGHMIRVDGSLTDGLTGAEIAG